MILVAKQNRMGKALDFLPASGTLGTLFYPGQ
jgi:hypothetical protein